MGDNRSDHRTDQDLMEEIDEDEMFALVKEAQREAIAKSLEDRGSRRKGGEMPKGVFWLIAVVFLFSTFSFVFQTYSLPAIDFLRTSSALSKNAKVQQNKKAVVTIEAMDGKGTGFAISGDGEILTNYHVVENDKKVKVTFSEEGMFIGKVIEAYPAIDLAVVKVEGEGFPYLDLAESPVYATNEPIQFIGNPLNFHGIANEGRIIDHIQLRDWEKEVVMMRAPVYRGNSGSPVLNEEGHVIGVVFATMNHDEFGRVGLFVPIHLFHDQEMQGARK